MLERRFELIGVIEVILQCALVAARHEDELLDTGGEAFLDRVLDEGAVDDGQHLLGHGFGRGQEPGTETSDRQDGFTDTLRHASTSFSG